MAASGARDRRPAIWPYIVMPLIIIAVFCALRRVHREPPAAPPASTAPTPASTPQP